MVSVVTTEKLKEDGKVEMSPGVEDLFLRYRAPDGSERPIVPEAVVQGAVPVDEEVAKNRCLVPADAVVGKESAVVSRRTI